MATYGTTPTQPTSSSSHGRSERDPLLWRPEDDSLLARLRRTLVSDVSRSWADLVLLLCYFVTGLLDSASTQVWGAFVSMQTGNPPFIPLLSAIYANLCQETLSTSASASHRSSTHPYQHVSPAPASPCSPSASAPSCSPASTGSSPQNVAGFSAHRSQRKLC